MSYAEKLKSPRRSRDKFTDFNVAILFVSKYIDPNARYATVCKLGYLEESRAIERLRDLLQDKEPTGKELVLKSDPPQDVILRNKGESNVESQPIQNQRET